MALIDHLIQLPYVELNLLKFLNHIRQALNYALLVLVAERTSDSILKINHKTLPEAGMMEELALEHGKGMPVFI